MKKKLSEKEKEDCREIAEELQKKLPQFKIKASNPGIIINGWHKKEIPYRKLKEYLKKYSIDTIKNEIMREYSFY